MLDACSGSAVPANAARGRSAIKDITIPPVVEQMVMNKVPSDLQKGLSIVYSEYRGRQRWDIAKSWQLISLYMIPRMASFLRVKG